jgi:hypothetical protein
MLHILNGSSIEGTLRDSTVPGEFFSFRDALIAGPAPGGLAEKDWREVRTQHLVDNYGLDPTTAANELLVQQEALSSFSTHDEVVLWFEHDLFCQLNLIYLLDWFGGIELGNTRLSLINIGEFPGHPNFRGLGELSTNELTSLFPARQQVSAEQLILARAAWKSFSANDPTEVERLLDEDTSGLPFLSESLKAHLQRFPATRNGLGRIENISLQLVDQGARRFNELFPAFSATEPIFGLGDAQVWHSLVEMCRAKNPLLIGMGQSSSISKEISTEMSFDLTDAGRAVLNGEADQLELNGLNVWLGGVHLQDSNIWRWDEAGGRLQHSTTR